VTKEMHYGSAFYNVNNASPLREVFEAMEIDAVLEFNREKDKPNEA